MIFLQLFLLLVTTGARISQLRSRKEDSEPNVRKLTSDAARSPDTWLLAAEVPGYKCGR